MAWAGRVAEGRVVCHLCGLPIVDGVFDLDHARGGDRLAPTHPHCNRSEGAQWKGKRRLAWGGGH